MKLKCFTTRRQTWLNFGILIYKSMYEETQYCLDIRLPYIEWFIFLDTTKDNPSYKD